MGNSTVSVLSGELSHPHVWVLMELLGVHVRGHISMLGQDPFRKEGGIVK